MTRLHHLLRVLRRVTPPLVLLGLLVAAWELWVLAAHVDAWELPSPGSIVRAGFDSRAVLRSHTWTTLRETGAGLVIGTVAGVLLAVAISSAAIVRRTVWPLVVTSQTIPIIVLAPLLAIWFGFGIAPKVVVVALVVFFPVAVSTVSGLAAADPEQVALVRSFGATRWQVLRLVLVPSALPELLAGLRISASYAIGGAVIGEYVGGTSGLGIFIDRSRASYRTDQMFAGVLVVAVLSIALFTAVQLLARLLTPWRFAPSSSHRSNLESP